MDEAQEADRPYSKAAYVEQPAIPDYHTLHEKTPAVQELRTLFDANDWDITYWHIALFYMFSKEDLAELKANPQAAREYGDAAELFGTLLTSGRVPAKYKDRKPAHPAIATLEYKRMRFGPSVDNRDRKKCVVTHKGKTFDHAYIVPFSVNSTGESLAYVPSILAIAERLLGESFRKTIQTFLRTPGGIDRIWNIITLTPYLHRLWDTYGLVGLRPCYVDDEPDKSGNVIYLATFTFHWLMANAIDDECPVPLRLSADDCFQMVSESKSFSEVKDSIFESVHTPGRQPPNDVQRLEDGHVCQVRFQSRWEAELMMHVLDLRWHASRLTCLSGAAGKDLLEPQSDDDDSENDCFDKA